MNEKNFLNETIDYKVDPLGRRVAFKTKNLQQTIDSFSKDGKVTKVTTSIRGRKDISTYEYGDLKQLTLKKGLFNK